MRLKLPISIPSLRSLGRASFPRRLAIANLICGCVAALLPVSAIAQLSQTPTAMNDASNSGDFVITERGPNHRVWRRITSVTNKLGEVSFETNGGYTELATGLYHLVDGQWVESSDAIQITPEGGVATNAQHQVTFAANINTVGAVHLTTPDGKHLRSHILGLSYLDSVTGQYVLIAQLKDSTGQIVGQGSNQVIYADAFNGGFKADVVYHNTKAGFEQDIVLREQPPSPAAFGLNPATTHLQVITEFLDAPVAQVRQARLADGTISDQVVDFGQMSIGQGKAFSMGNDSDGAVGEVPVNKRWLLLNNRRVLVEDVPFPVITPQLQDLPVPSIGAGTKKQASANGLLHRVSGQIQLPPPPELASHSSASMKLAALSTMEKGFVLDYNTLTTGQTNYTFQGDTTYYISGPVALSGTSAFEGGAVIKYATNASLNVLWPAALNSLATAYRPVIFTAKDDNSVGASISGSTGSPTNYYANPAIAYTGSANSGSGFSLDNFRISYAQQAINASGISISINLSDGQIVNCGNPFYTPGQAAVSVENVLMANFQTAFVMSLCNVHAQNSTFVGLLQGPPNYAPSFLAMPAFGSGSMFLNFQNCILADITAFCPANPGALNGDHNGFYGNSGSAFGTVTVTAPVYPFQAVGAGNYYLTNSSGFTNWGTTNIDPALLAKLRKKTTYPPIVLSNLTVSYMGTNLLPQALRDTNSTLNLGYHYDPLDYLFSHITVGGSPITLSNGVAVGLFGTSGFVVQAGGFNSQGRADTMNRLAWYPSVQEQAVKLAGVSTVNSAIFSTAGGSPELITLRFTDLPMLGNRQPFFDQCYSYNGPMVNVKDSWLRGINLAVNRYFVTGFLGSSVTLQNNLLERSTVNLNAGYVDYFGDGTAVYQNPLNLGFYNNLFWQSSLALSDLDREVVSPYQAYWVMSDNLFDTTAFTFSGDGSYTNDIHIYTNAYFNTANPLGEINPLIVTNLTYATAALGPWYIGSASPSLVDRGSRLASALGLGLYHYTTQPNQVKETNSIVDIGFHYVAVKGNGNPVDTDGDGVPDYIEDSNGDGIYDAGDISNWRDVMVVGWGNDVAGQCDVPFGLTNVTAVAGGGGQSLALINNGKVVAWGQNAYGEGSVPTNITGVSMIAAGWYHDLALLSNGTVSAWGLDAHGLYNLTEVPTNLTGVAAISAQALHSLALGSNGLVTAWGYGPSGEAAVPSNISNVVAISAGYQFNLAVKTDGTVAAWGDNSHGECNVPANLSNVVAVAAGLYDGLALLNNHTVVAWGDNSGGQTNVPPGLTNVVAISASGDPAGTGSAYCLALTSDGRVVAWGAGQTVAPVGGLTNVISIAAGADAALAVRLGPLTPVITLEPVDQYQIAGGTVTFSSRGAGLYGVTYQWQFNGVNIVGATNASLVLNNVQAAQQGVYNVLVSNEVGSILSSNANLYLVTVPIINSQSLPTNQTVYYQGSLTLNVSASAPGQSNGFPLGYQWQFNGTNIAGANTNFYTLTGGTGSAGTYSVVVTNAAGAANAAWQITINYSTLAYYLATNLTSYTNGFTGSYTDMLIWSNWSYASYTGTNLAFLTNAVWAPGFWLHNVKGLPATALGYSNGLGRANLVDHGGISPPLPFRHACASGGLAGGVPRYE